MTPRVCTALAGAAVLALVVVGGAVVEQLDGGGSGGGTLSASSARPSPSLRSAAPRSTRQAPSDGLPVVTPADLPVEARRTLTLIDAGGPFPYDRDGVVFANREGLLPAQSRGCYHEYTVRTPGESDRGARRIITSCTGPRYWTADHYESFARIDAARL